LSCVWLYIVYCNSIQHNGDVSSAKLKSLALIIWLWKIRSSCTPVYDEVSFVIEFLTAITTVSWMVNSVLGEPATHIATQKPVLENWVRGFDCKSSNHNRSTRCYNSEDFWIRFLNYRVSSPLLPLMQYVVTPLRIVTFHLVRCKYVWWSSLFSEESRNRGRRVCFGAIIKTLVNRLIPVVRHTIKSN
jgi:hypothetical protein